MIVRTVDECWAWSITFGAFLMNLLIIGFVKSFTLLVSDLREYFQTSTSTIMLSGGLVVSLIALISPIASLVCHRFSTRSTALCASVAACICFVMSSFVRNPVSFVFLFAIIGTCFSMIYIPVLSMLPRCHKKRHSLSSGIAMSGSSAGLIIMAPVILILLRDYHITQTLSILGAIFLHLCISAILMPEIVLNSENSQPIYCEGRYRFKEKMEPANPNRKSPKSYFSFIKRRYVLYVLAACMANAGYTGQYTIFAGFSNEHGVSEFHIGLCMVLQGFVEIFVRVFAGWIGDFKILPHWIYLVVSLMLMSTNSIFSALMAIYNPGYVFWVLYSCLLVVSGSFYQIYVFIEASSVIGVKKFGQAYSLNMMFLGITNTPSQYFLGFLKDVTGKYIWSMVLCSFLSGLSLLIFLLYHMLPMSGSKKSAEIDNTTQLNLIEEKDKVAVIS